jgi:hypothetical protein
MGNLVFLLAALAVIALGTLILALRAREPKGFDSGIKAHQRHMNALSTETRRESTGIDRIQPVRRVDPLTGPAPAKPDRPADQNGDGEAGPQESEDPGRGSRRRPGASGGEG